MKVCVFGAGAVGGYIGGAWAAAGLEITLIGRESLCEEIAANGITLSEGGAKGPPIRLSPEAVRCTTDPAALADADIILLTVKSAATQGAAETILRHARPGTPVLSFQNGIRNVDRLRAAISGYPVLAGIVPYNIVRLRPGHWHKAVGGDLIAQDAKITRALVGAIGNRPGRLELSDDMPGLAWGKLLMNLNNAVNALAGKPLLEQLKDRDYRRVLAGAQAEALAAMRIAGIKPGKMGPVPPEKLPGVIALPNALFNFFLRIQKVDPKARSSMADDLDAGRLTEIDYLNGEVVALARQHRRKTPINSAIVDLVREAEQGGRRDWSGPELRQRVLGK